MSQHTQTANDRSEQKANGSSSSGVLERAAIREPHMTTKAVLQNQHHKGNPAHILAHTMRYIPCRITEDVNKCCSRRRRERTVDEDEDSRHRNSEYVTRGRDMKRENTHARTNAP